MIVERDSRQMSPRAALYDRCHRPSHIVPSIDRPCVAARLGAITTTRGNDARRKKRSFASNWAPLRAIYPVLYINSRSSRRRRGRTSATIAKYARTYIRVYIRVYAYERWLRFGAPVYARWSSIVAHTSPHLRRAAPRRDRRPPPPIINADALACSLEERKNTEAAGGRHRKVVRCGAVRCGILSVWSMNSAAWVACRGETTGHAIMARRTYVRTIINPLSLSLSPISISISFPDLFLRQRVSRDRRTRIPPPDDEDDECHPSTSIFGTSRGTRNYDTTTTYVYTYSGARANGVTSACTR